MELGSHNPYSMSCPFICPLMCHLESQMSHSDKYHTALGFYKQECGQPHAEFSGKLLRQYWELKETGLLSTMYRNCPNTPISEFLRSDSAIRVFFRKQKTTLKCVECQVS